MPTRESFVKTWQKAETAEAAARALGLSQASAERRARRYRSRGIPLKLFGDPREMDVEELARLARKSAPSRKIK